MLLTQFQAEKAKEAMVAADQAGAKINLFFIDDADSGSTIEVLDVKIHEGVWGVHVLRAGGRGVGNCERYQSRDEFFAAYSLE